MTTPRDAISGTAPVCSCGRLLANIRDKDTGRMFCTKCWDNRDAIAIAGLSELLKRHGSGEDGYRTVFNGTMLEAATQLDSLLKERDLLQERVKELEVKYERADQEADHYCRHYEKADDSLKKTLVRACRAEQERDSLKVDCSAYASRNTNLLNDVVLAGMARDAAEQERDEAYERAVKVADKKADDLLDAASRLQGYIGATKLAYTEADLHEQAGTAIKALVDEIRRLAGPEKEKKE